MPNTPCLVGASASAMCLGGAATEEDGEAVRTLFAAVGTIVKVRAWCLDYAFAMLICTFFSDTLLGKFQVR